jgi:hypothetical protein
VDLLYSEPIIFEPALNIIDFENSEFLDTIVVVKGKNFKVFKAILMRRSPVFEKMVRL